MTTLNDKVRNWVKKSAHNKVVATPQKLLVFPSTAKGTQQQTAMSVHRYTLNLGCYLPFL